MHHEEDQGLWLPCANEPAPNCHVAEDEVDQGKESSEQCVFLVLHDFGVEYDVLTIRTLLS
jgi:hypothetical protein